MADVSAPDAVSTGEGQTDAGSPALEGAGQDAGTNGVHFEGGAPADGGEVHEGGSTVGGATEAGSPIAIPLSTLDGTYYTAVATVGTQTFALDIDTGSATAAIAGSGCDSCTSAGVSPLYEPAAPATDEGRSAESLYAGGSSWTGEVFLDTLGLWYGSPSVPLELVEIESENQFLGGGATFQGILGLGPSDLAVRGTDAYVSQETAAGVSPVLAFELCYSGGTMWLGGFDGSAAATMQYTPLLAIGKSNPYYSINVDDLLIGGSSLGFQAADFQSPVLDTGTSLFYLPTPVFDAMLSAINGSSGYSSVFGSMPLSAGGNGCVSAQGATAASVDAALPTMALTLPGNGAGAPSFTVELQPTQSYLLDAGRGTFCLAAGDGGTRGGAILGDAFLSAFVTVIDQPNLRAGFAPDAGCSAQPGRRAIDLTTWHPRLPRRRIRR